MLRQVKNLGVIPERLKVLLRLAVLQLAHLGLSEPEPPPQQLLIQRLAEELKVTRVVSIRLEHLADVLAFEGRTKLVRLEELVPQFGGRRPELVALLPVAL